MFATYLTFLNSQESIQLRLFPFSLKSDVVFWLQKFLKVFISFLVKLMEAFLDWLFPPFRTLKLRDKITDIQQVSREPLDGE